ncbi:lipid A deacylase LpxR family protein [Tenacibaculum sp. 190524A02b]|uniref:lipid A deacylase LpxR family protein n=1 Tax=Tenacibaculum vairaonense TaxID=3137860 RepID=UPI0031FB5817
MKKIVLLLLMFIGSYSYSQSGGLQFFITHENDFLGLNNRDENYTGGLNLEFVFKEINVWQPFFRFSNGTNYQTISLGGLGYTPRDLEATEVLYDDRPYSSLVYFSLGKLAISADGKSSISSKLFFGLVGSSGPGKIQYFLHDVNAFGSTRPNPNGWNNQIGFDGAFIMNYNIRYLRSLLDLNSEKTVNYFKPKLMLGGALGNYMINVEAGLFLELLNVNAYPTLGINNVVMPLNKVDGINHRNKNFRLNLYVRPKVRYVGYNTALEGLLFNDNSVHKIAREDMERFIFEFDAGVNLLIANRFYLKYALSLRTKEYINGKDVHFWGGITLGVSPEGWFVSSDSIPKEKD